MLGELDQRAWTSDERPFAQTIAIRHWTHLQCGRSAAESSAQLRHLNPLGANDQPLGRV